MASINRDTLDKPVNENVKDGRQNKAVKSFLEVIADGFVDKNSQDSRNKQIQDLFESAFLISNPSGTRKLNAQRLYQAMWRTANRMKPLDFQLHGAGRPEWAEKIVTDGVATVMDGGGYDSALRDKGGAFFNLLMYGDSFIQVGANPDPKSKIPIVFNPISNDKVYVDRYATGVRTKGWGRNATKMVVIFTYSWGDLIKQWPEAEKIAGIGKIPRGDAYNQLERTDIQDKLLEDEVEVAYAYDIINKNFTVFAGQACTVLQEENGDDYPFVKDGEPYIPISQFICMPASEGFYNHGIGSMVYKLATISRRLMNMELGHIEDNTYPIELVSVPQGEAAKFFGKLKQAHNMRAAGKKGYAVIERDPSDPNGSAVSSQSLLTQSLVSEWQMVFDQLDREIRRCGINIDELEPGASATATEILALEENSNAFVKQIMEYNASESQFMVELTLDFIKKFVSKNDKTPVDMTTVIVVEGTELDVTGTITMGQVADEIKKNRYFVKVNSRTGAIPSNAMRRAQIANIFQAAAPGSKAQVALLGQLAALENIDLKGEEFLPAPPPQAEAAPQGAGDLEEIAQGQPTGTDRQTINPRLAEQTAIL
jgi:hypothetical protein